MKNISLEETIKRIYDERVLFIRDKNIDLERQYFSSDKLGFLTNGLSYDDNFTYMIKELKKQSVSESKIESIFISLQEVFLFSKGHDMMFKKKLNADVFVSIPMDNLIYPMLVEGIKEKYNDCGVMLYDLEHQKEVQAGGSGPVCSALVVYSDIIRKLANKELKRVLYVATGALFNPTLVFQKKNILSIAHAVSLESVEWYIYIPFYLQVLLVAFFEETYHFA